MGERKREDILCVGEEECKTETDREHAGKIKEEKQDKENMTKKSMREAM